MNPPADLQARVLRTFSACLDDESLRALHLLAFGDVVGLQAYVEPPVPDALRPALEAAIAEIVPMIPGAARGAVTVVDDVRRVRGVHSPRNLAKVEPDVGPWLARRLVRDGVVPWNQVENLEGSARADRDAIALGLATEAEVTACVARFHRLPTFDLAPLTPSLVSHALSFTTARELHAVPLRTDEGELLVVMDDPSNARTRASVEWLIGGPVTLAVASWSAVERLLNPPHRADGRCRFCGESDAPGMYDGACESCANPYLGIVW